jgi:hypothetical protein
MTVGVYNGINYAKSQTVPPTMVHASCAGKRVTMIDTVEVDTTTGLATCTLTFFKPPRGSRIIGGNLFAEALVTGGTLSVGTGATKYARTSISATVPFESVDYTDDTSVVADVDKFLAATTIGTTPAKTALIPIALIDVFGYEFDGETTVTVTSATADMVNAKRVTLQIDLILP